MPVTSNPNNTYQVEIIESTDISGLVSTPQNLPSFVQTAANGEEFMEWKITPNTIGYPLIAANLRLNGAVPYSNWRAGTISYPGFTSSNPNIQPSNQRCTAPRTPHDLTPTITPLPAAATLTWVYGTSCSPIGLGPWAPNNSINESKQVYIFYTTNSGLGAGAIVGDLNSLGISSEYTIMVEVYEDDNGNLVNDNLTPATSYLPNTTLANSPGDYMWIHWDAINHAPITNNIYPKYIKCFSFIQYNSNILNYQAPQILDLLYDLDEIPPVNGCTDPSALNYDANAVVDDGSCSYLSQFTYQIQLDFSTSEGYSPPGVPGVISPGPYTDGSTYSFTTPYPQNQTYSYTTDDFDQVMQSHGFTSPIQNLTFDGGASSQTVMLQGMYNPGDHVNEVVDVYVYPLSITQLSNTFPVIYDFPGVGGPNAQFNLPDPSSPDYADYVQRMYAGWGDAKNNLTAASLRVGVGATGWLDPYYEDPAVLPGPISMSLWHNGPDPTGLQPTRTVNFSQNGSLPPEVSGISAMEEYLPDGINAARDYFPYRIRIRVELDFFAPSPQQSFTGQNPFNSSNTLYTLPVSVIHITSNQGDLNWSI
jgi:hypothetical protein